MKHISLLLIGFLLIAGCKKDEESNDPGPAPTGTTGPQLIFKFTFDEDQVRLDNLGNPAPVAEGNAAQTPRFNSISANYIELAPNAMTALGGGEVLYVGPETTAGGEVAIDIDQARFVSEDEVFVSIPLSEVAAGSYGFVRVSLSYQNFDIDFRAAGLDWEGTLAGFIGYNNFISSYTIKNQSVDVNGNRLQGYWGFETLNQVIEGQAPAGATTVVNPLWATSPVPEGSCVVTGAFPSDFVLTGNETEDVLIELSLSVNDSFEWNEVNEDGLFEPEAGEQVVDMGIRGLLPVVLP